MKNNLNRVDIQNGWYIYVEEYFSAQESIAYFNRFIDDLLWEDSQIKIFGKIYPTPRLEAFYSENFQEYSYSGKKLKVNQFHPYLLKIKLKLEQDFDLNFNSVLANLYRNGNDSNGWHADDEKELGKFPIVCSVSFGEQRRFDLKHNESKERLSFELKSGDLLIMGGEIQHFWKHQLAKSKRIFNPRINLTFRKIF